MKSPGSRGLFSALAEVRRSETAYSWEGGQGGNFAARFHEPEGLGEPGGLSSKHQTPAEPLLIQVSSNRSLGEGQSWRIRPRS